MTFDPTLTFGNVLTVAITVASIVWSAHKSDRERAIQHEQNVNKLENLTQQIDRVESKVEQSRRDVNGTNIKLNDIDKKIDVHAKQDEVLQHEIVRRLDRLDE